MLTTVSLTEAERSARDSGPRAKAAGAPRMGSTAAPAPRISTPARARAEPALFRPYGRALDGGAAHGVFCDKPIKLLSSKQVERDRCSGSFDCGFGEKLSPRHRSFDAMERKCARKSSKTSWSNIRGVRRKNPLPPPPEKQLDHSAKALAVRSTGRPVTLSIERTSRAWSLSVSAA